MSCRHLLATLVALVALAALVLVPGVASAAGTQRAWTGDGHDSLWSNAANWEGGQLPEPEDSVLIGGAETVQITSDVTIDSAVIQGSATLVVEAGHVLTTTTAHQDVTIEGTEESGLAPSVLVLHGTIDANGDDNDLQLEGSGDVNIHGTGRFGANTVDVHANNTTVFQMGTLPLPASLEDLDFIHEWRMMDGAVLDGSTAPNSVFSSHDEGGLVVTGNVTVAPGSLNFGGGITVAGDDATVTIASTDGGTLSPQFGDPTTIEFTGTGSTLAFGGSGAYEFDRGAVASGNDSTIEVVDGALLDLRNRTLDLSSSVHLDVDPSGTGATVTGGEDGVIDNGVVTFHKYVLLDGDSLGIGPGATLVLGKLGGLAPAVTLRAGTTVWVEGVLDLNGGTLEDDDPSDGGHLVIADNGTLRSDDASTRAYVEPLTTVRAQGSVVASPVGGGGGVAIAFDDLSNVTGGSGAKVLQDGLWTMRGNSTIDLGTGEPLAGIAGDAGVEITGADVDPGTPGTGSGFVYGLGGADAIAARTGTFTIGPGAGLHYGDGGFTPYTNELHASRIDVAGALWVRPRATLALPDGSPLRLANEAVPTELDASGVLRADVELGARAKLRGVGTIDGSISTTAPSAIVEPGSGGNGTLTVTGDADLATGTLRPYVRTTSPTSDNVLAVTGTVSIQPAASINVRTVPAPSALGLGFERSVMTAGTFEGTFGAVSSDFGNGWGYTAAYPAASTAGSLRIRLADLGAPTNPTTSASTSHTSAPSQVRTVDVALGGASDAETSVVSYVAVWDHSATTVPVVSGNALIPVAQSTLASAPLADGTWYLHLRSVDEVGNLADGAVHLGPFVIDTTAPAAPVVSGAPAGTTTSSTSATLTLTGEAGATFVCSLDAAPFAPCTSPVTISALALGEHSFRAAAVDAASNVGVTTTAAWKVVEAPPANDPKSTDPTPTDPGPSDPKPATKKPSPPKLAQIKPVGSLKLAAVGRSGAVALRFPDVEAGVAVTAELTVTAAQARALGLSVRRGQRTVVIGTASGVLTTKTSTTVTIKLTRAAKAAFARAGARDSKVRSVQATFALTLSNAAGSRRTNAPLAFPR